MLGLEYQRAVVGCQGIGSRTNGIVQKNAFPTFLALPNGKGFSRTSLKVKADGHASITSTKAAPLKQDDAFPGSLKIVIPKLKEESEYFENSAQQNRVVHQKKGKRPGRNVFQQMAAAALDLVERTLIPHIEGQAPLPSTADPQVQLEGNFAPVPESAVQHELQVVGTLPQVLDGVYVRNGANPRFTPLAGHHFFDGDGMIQAVRFKDGIASHCCRYTKTYRLQEEEKEGKAFFPKAIGELHGHGGIARLMLYFARGLAGLVDMKQGMGVANAGLVFHNGRLLAMSEDDLPYAVSIKEDGDLETVGRFDFDGQHKTSMIAHPKIDPATGELFALSYNVIKAPYLQYFTIAPDGTKSREVSITLQGPTMIHDFAITEQYVVIPDQQVVFRMAELLKGGSPVAFDPTKTSRFGILPKYNASESGIQWIDVPDCFCFHLWNSWEEGDEVVILGSCMTPADSIFNEHSGSLQSFLSEIRLNMKTGKSTRRKLADINLEAGQLNRNYVGRKSRFLYLAVAEPWPKISGVAKVDMEAKNTTEGAVIGKHIHPEGCYGGEPVFVPRTSNVDAKEDDGYVLTFRHNERTNQSELLVLDASTPNLDLIASVQLPSRVPYGLHGTFIPTELLATQRPPF